MNLRLSVLSVSLFGIATAVPALASECDEAKDIAQVTCAAGDRLDVQADGNGQLTILRLAPGGSLSLHYTKVKENGSFIADPQYRSTDNENIRACMKQHVGRLYDACLSHPQPQIPWRSEVISTPESRGTNVGDRRCWPPPEGYHFDFSTAHMTIDGRKGWFSNHEADHRYNGGAAKWERTDKGEICVVVEAIPTLKDAYAQTVGQVEVTAVR